MQITKHSRNVLRIRMDDVKEGWEQWFLLTSDRHFDSKKSHKELMIEHLDLAKKRNAKVLEFGDTFDAMQGKYDPRRAYPEMATKYIDMMNAEGIGYLDAIVKDAKLPFTVRRTIRTDGKRES